MKKEKKTAFKMPYAGIDHYRGLPLLYGENGDFSVVIAVSNPSLRLAADPESFIGFQGLMLNIVKVLGEEHIVQKQDVLIRRKFKGPKTGQFLQDKYFGHFEDRPYTDIQTYLIITRQVKKGAFYVFDKKKLADFYHNTAKVFDLLYAGGLSPRYLNSTELNRYVSRILGMEFSMANIVLDNIRCGDTELGLGDRSVRCISLVNTDSVDLPEKIAPYHLMNDAGLKDFPVDNLSFFWDVPGYDTIVYNQLLAIPNQRTSIGKLELKRKRHSGVPDPANLICVEDIDRLLVDVARDGQLLVQAHFSIVLCCKTDQITKAANFIEAALFQQGIIPSKNAYNQLELFRCALPGNGVELKGYDWFLTTADAALCFFFRETAVKDDSSDFLVRFTDRQGIPIGIDLADLPMRTNRINNRNKFVLGPSGSGKSFFMNAKIEQYLYYNMDVVIVDTGHSYSGLCSYFGGKYITWFDDRPITMNPFAIAEAEYNIEKKDFLVTLVSLLWKGAEGTVSSVERDVVSAVISAYFSGFFSGSSEFIIEKLCFDSFYEFALYKVPRIKAEEHIPFDLDEFRYVLKKFYKGGEFDSILNEQADSSLFSERLIVFEIDAVKENKILFPIVTLVIMDVFIQKMRHRKDQRKALIIEEAWKAIASPLMGGYILYLYKTVRKFWGECIVVTQELGDILGNAIVKDSILNNSDTICLLDQSKFRENYGDIARLLSITDIEQKKIFTVNRLENTEGRGRFKEVYIRRGATGEVYGVEVSIFQYLAFTTEKPEKSAVEAYVSAHGDFKKGLEAFVFDLKESGLPLESFVARVNGKATNQLSINKI